VTLTAGPPAAGEPPGAAAGALRTARSCSI
jgi:hypothetical protein